MMQEKVNDTVANKLVEVKVCINSWSFPRFSRSCMIKTDIAYAPVIKKSHLRKLGCMAGSKGYSCHLGKWEAFLVVGIKNGF